MGSVVSTAAGLLAVLTVAGGTAVAGAAGVAQAQAARVAEAAAESVAQNGCYTQATEQAIRDALAKSGIDPARTAVTATTARQPYGGLVRVRVEYARDFRLIGSRPLRWYAAADIEDVTTQAPVLPAGACRAPGFAPAQGKSGLEFADEDSGQAAGGAAGNGDPHRDGGSQENGGGAGAGSPPPTGTGSGSGNGGAAAADPPKTSIGRGAGGQVDGRRSGAYVYDADKDCWRHSPEPGRMYAAVMPPGTVCGTSGSSGSGGGTTLPKQVNGRDSPQYALPPTLKGRR